MQENCIAIKKLYCDSRGSGLLDCVTTKGRDTASKATTLRGGAQQCAGAHSNARRWARGARRWARGARRWARGARRWARGARSRQAGTAQAAGMPARADARGAIDALQGRGRKRTCGARQAHGRGTAGARGEGQGCAGLGRGARGVAGARGPRMLPVPACCALGALSLFLARFDSVLFLSRFLDMVREPDS